MNSTVYLFGNLGQGYMQYPSGENGFVVINDFFIEETTRMVIQQKDNLICYKYIYQGSSFYIGLCIVFNEVIAHDVQNLYTTLELLFEDHILRNPALFENSTPKMTEFQESSEELQNVTTFFERMLSNSDFGYESIEPIGSATILQDTITLSLDTVNDDDVISALSKYKKIILCKNNKKQTVNTLSAINRIQKESEDWIVKTKDYDSSSRKSSQTFLIFLAAAISFFIPYLMFLSPKARTQDQIDRIRNQIWYANSVREELSRKLSIITDSINMIQKELTAISRQSTLLENAQERKKTRRTFTIGDTEFTMIKVTGGTFLMGSSSGESDESPTHYVTLRSYYIGETEVTQELWSELMYSNPSSHTGNQRPVTNISWNDCMTFVRKLNERTGLSFALPTEAQWEFAARGGNRSRGYKYSGSDSYSAVANCVEYSFWGELLGYSNSIDNVACHSSNELGIYDMSGNAWEWCYDSYSNYSYSEEKNPVNDGGENRVIRGGGYKNTPSYCRTTYRGSKKYDGSAENIGFRLVLNE